MFTKIEIQDICGNNATYLIVHNFNNKNNQHRNQIYKKIQEELSCIHSVQFIWDNINPDISTPNDIDRIMYMQ